MNNNIVLSGHTIDLRLPTNEDVINGDWVYWYNNSEITKYNNHGIYPINKDAELIAYVDPLPIGREYAEKNNCK